MTRTGKLSPEARDDHYREFDRLLGSAAGLPPRRFKQACPSPDQITIPEEIFWLTVMIAQMRWPWPHDIKNALADLPRSSRFSVEQARYLLRHDPDVTVLHAAKGGALIAGWPAELAASTLVDMARRQQSLGDAELTGRWPLPTDYERRHWEEEKNTFFRERHRHLTRDETVAWLCLAYGQMGWPVPSVLTRFFPIDWTQRKMDSALLANIVKDISVADAVIADVRVKGLDRAGLLTAAESWARYERSREAEANAGGLPAFVMFRDKLPRSGPQGRLYRRLFHDAQAVLVGDDQQPVDRLQLLAFVNRQSAVDGELARQEPVTDVAREPLAHHGIRVAPPLVKRTAPKQLFPPPKITPGLGIVCAKPDDYDDDETDADDEDTGIQDEDDVSANEGRRHEPVGETPSTLPRNGGEQDGAENTEDVFGNQLTLPAEDAWEATRHDGAASGGHPLSGDVPQEAEQIQRGLGSTTEKPGVTTTPVDAPADRVASNERSLTGTAARGSGDFAEAEKCLAPAADDAGQDDAAVVRKPQVGGDERTAREGHFPEGAPLKDRSEDIGDHTGPGKASTLDADWEEEFNNPEYSFRNRRRQATSADIPAEGVEERAPVSELGEVEAMSDKPESSLKDRARGSTQAVFPSDNEKGIGKGDKLMGSEANDRSAASGAIFQPAALAAVAKGPTAGSADKAVASQDLLAPGISQPGKVHPKSAREQDQPRDEGSTSASAPNSPLPSALHGAVRSKQRLGNAPREEEPRHEVAHPLAEGRVYRHDVVQSPGSQQPRGYEVERIKVRRDELDDPS